MPGKKILSEMATNYGPIALSLCMLMLVSILCIVFGTQMQAMNTAITDYTPVDDDKCKDDAKLKTLKTDFVYTNAANSAIAFGVIGIIAALVALGMMYMNKSKTATAHVDGTTTPNQFTTYF